MKSTLTKYIHSRAAAIILMIVAVCASVSSYRTTDISFTSTHPMMLEEPSLWLHPGWTSFAVNIICNIAIAVTLLIINRTFKPIRSITWIFVGLFFFMQMAQPPALDAFGDGSFQALVLLAMTGLLFTTYADAWHTRSLFMLFFMLALASLSQYSLLLYIPVFLLGVVQMRIFHLRTLLAIVMGIITPLWIIIGFDLVPPDKLLPPMVQSSGTDLSPDHSRFFISLFTTAITGGIGLIFTFANLMKVMSYNSARRAFNGFLTLMFIATLLFVAIDHTNYPVYVPTLNILSAYQIGHFFTLHRLRLSYIPVFIILLIYAAIAAITPTAP